MDAMVALTSGANSEHFWTSVNEFYENGQFVDVILSCKNGRVKCHGLVLGSLSPMLRAAILSDSASSSEPANVVLDGFVVGDVLRAVDAVYG